MVRSATGSEYLLAQKTAEEYRSKGYEVLREHPIDFLPGFRADLIVRKDDQVKVIEVKSRSSLSADPRISKLARIIDAKPGWSFELLLVGEPEIVSSPEGARPFEIESINQRVDQAEKVLGLGLSEAALLLAWSAGEAAARVLVASQGTVTKEIKSSRHVLDQAVYYGVISNSEYRDLVGMQKYRNAIVHGFSVEDFSDNLVTELLKIVRRITAAAVGEVKESERPAGQ